MKQSATLEQSTCYHCGDECTTSSYIIEKKQFCCHGCQSVYQILAENKLCSYYTFNDHPGATRARNDKRFAYLSDAEIIRDLLDYTDGEISIVTF